MTWIGHNCTMHWAILFKKYELKSLSKMQDKRQYGTGGSNDLVTKEGIKSSLLKKIRTPVFSPVSNWELKCQRCNLSFKVPKVWQVTQCDNVEKEMDGADYKVDTPKHTYHSIGMMQLPIKEQHWIDGGGGVGEGRDKMSAWSSL